MSEEFDKAYWEGRYRGHTPVGSGEPNPQLVAEVGDFAPGTALEAGCGEGANAIWLASRGWRVTAVDLSSTALRRAREHAETLGTDVTSRIDWVQADLTVWTPIEEHFDLVCAHYVHPAASREALFRRLAASVAPGGTLLIVDHHPSHSHTSTPHTSMADTSTAHTSTAHAPMADTSTAHTSTAHAPMADTSTAHASTAHASAPTVHITAEEIAASLDPDRWDITVAEARTRTATVPHGHEITLHDTVLRARKHP